jgi:hypothetical protein
MTTKKSTSTAPALIQPDTKKIEKESSSIVTQAKAITVKDEESYRKGSDVIDAGNAILKQVNDTFDPLVSNAHKLHKDLLATKKQFTDPIESALRAIKRQMSDWQMQLERDRKAKEAELAEQARKEALEQAQREALVLEGQGEAEAADEVIQTAIEAPAPAITLPSFQSSDFGRTTRSVWKWKITDVSKIPVHFLTVTKNASTQLEQDISTAAIGVLVRTLKNKEMAEAQFKGGVQVWEDKTII